MKCRSMALILSLLVAAASEAAQPPTALANRGQEKDNWCGIAASEMILDWSGANTTQTLIANYAVAGADTGIPLDSGNGGWGPWLLPGLPLKTFKKGVKQVLEVFAGLKSTFRSSPLSELEAKAVLDAGAPFVIRQHSTYVEKSSEWGHAIVVKGYSGSNFLIEDPWPLDYKPMPGKLGISATIPYALLLSGQSPNGYREIVLQRNDGKNVQTKWTDTLVLGRSLDVVFLIDSTTSMSPYINSVKQSANTLVQNLSQTYKDVRFAVVDYRDYPFYPHGTPGVDYITNVRTPFTTNVNTVVAAINAISLAGGGTDLPEAVLSAIERTATGAEIGGWREGGHVSRHIVLLGDAPGKLVDPAQGGKTLADCIAALNDPLHPVSLQGIQVDSDPAAGSDFATVSGGSGGQVVSTTSVTAVAGLIQGVIGQAAEGRFPAGRSSGPTPTFRFEGPSGSTASSPEVTRLAIDLEIDDPRRGWRRYKRLSVGDPNASTYALTRPLPAGSYRWRLSGSTKSRTINYMDGPPARQDRLGRFVEESYTYFDRISNPPGPIEKFTVDCPASPNSRYDVYFEDDPTADAYSILTLDIRGKVKEKIFKRSKLTSSSTGIVSARLSVRRGEQFCWVVQGLNYDRRKPDQNAYN